MSTLLVTTILAATVLGALLLGRLLRSLRPVDHHPVVRDDPHLERADAEGPQ